MSGAHHGLEVDLAFARAALSLAWPDARRSGAAFCCDIALGASVATLRAHCEPGWIVLCTSGLPHAESSRALGWSAGLAGGAKFAVTARGELEARAELPPDADAPIALRLRAARAGITEALHRVATGASATSHADGAIGAAASAGLAAVARDAGFVVHERPEGRWATEIGSATAAALAEVSGDANGDGVAARVELVERASLDAVSRSALLRFLLRSNAAFRLVRATFVETEAAVRAQLEVVFDAAPSAGEWRAALGALAVAARHTRREATALADDPALARRYLAAQPALPPPRATRARSETPDVVRPYGPNARV